MKQIFSPSISDCGREKKLVVCWCPPLISPQPESPGSAAQVDSYGRADKLPAEMMTAMGAGWCLNGSKCPQIPPVLSTLTYYLLTHCDRRWPGQQLRPAGGRLLLLSVLNSKHITSVWKETEQSQSQPHLNTTNSPAPFKTTAITSTHFQKYKMQYEYNDEMKTHRKCLKCYVYLFSNKKQTMKTCNDRVYVGNVHNLIWGPRHQIRGHFYIVSSIAPDVGGVWAMGPQTSPTTQTCCSSVAPVKDFPL